MLLVRVERIESNYLQRMLTPEHPALVPINTIRNIVADYARTNFIFTVDIDFIPSSTL